MSKSRQRTQNEAPLGMLKPVIEKLIDVLKVFVHTSDEIIYQEIALIKVTTKGLLSGNVIDHVVRTHHARLLDVSPEYIVIEKTGHKAEINDLLSHLEPYGVLQYARSGRVAITKQVKEVLVKIMVKMVYPDLVELSIHKITII